MNNKFDIFINKANSIHNNFYSYDKVNYINARTKIIITCPIHCDFNQLPYNHLMGKGCNKCSIDRNKKNFTKSVSDFITQSNIIHNGIYDYSEVNYVNDSIKVDIICPIHGPFSQTPNKHLMGQGCPKCKIYRTQQTNIKKYSQLFPNRSDKIHSSFYDYSKVSYINSKTPVDIICPTHGVFSQIPNNHLNGKGCPKCNQSKGEIRIERYLIENNIKYITQKKFEDCIKDKKLSFDFWLFDSNLLIEFDGLQHFLPLGFQGGLKKLEYTRECDRIKDEYCKIKNIRLLRISYKDINNIAKILSDNI